MLPSILGDILQSGSPSKYVSALTRHGLCKHTICSLLPVTPCGVSWSQQILVTFVAVYQQRLCIWPNTCLLLPDIKETGIVAECLSHCIQFHTQPHNLCLQGRANIKVKDLQYLTLPTGSLGVSIFSFPGISPISSYTSSVIVCTLNRNK